MNTAPPSVGLVTPLKSLWHWLLTTPESSKPLYGCNPAPLPLVVRRANAPRKHAPRNQPPMSVAPLVGRPLRMVRVIEAGQTSAQVGRMVISGRMADVCAELDRLAAAEPCMH